MTFFLSLSANTESTFSVFLKIATISFAFPMHSIYQKRCEYYHHLIFLKILQCNNNVLQNEQLVSGCRGICNYFTVFLKGGISPKWREMNFRSSWWELKLKVLTWSARK